MSRRAARWILWTTFALTIPLPFFLAETGRVPAACLLMLGGIAASVIAVEGAQGAVGIAAALLFGQALLYLGLLWLGVRLLGRLLPRSPRATALVTTTVVLAALTIASSFEIYDTPFRTRSLRASLLHVYE